MNDKTVTDALLREFLLGNVNEEERARIESLFLTDSQARERVLGVEQDLIEDYLEGTLSPADRERFVARYAQTAEQRRKLRITKSIKDWAITEAAATQVAPAKGSYWRSLRERRRLKPAFVIPIVVMALIVIVVAAIWLSRRAEHAAIERELAQLNAPANLLEAPVSLELSPVTVRGVEPQRELNAGAQSAVVVLRLLLIQKERYASYQATFRRVGYSESYIIRNPQAESDGKAIRIKLPAQMLTKGTYQIALSGISRDGSATTADEYQFTVGG